ncbi:MAG: hypothetical protein H6587_06025 [Flavobacteriales bacterium]|nr:hypothetical protein [Flavobacteriales bacterium]MCB9364105.1 hypothetical protein [Flavobacteriales bacterium]
MKRVLQILIITICLTSCSSEPIDRKVSTDNLDKDFKEIRKSLSKEESDMLEAFYFIKSVSAEPVSEMTYSELLEEAKKYDKEEKARIEEKKKEKEAEMKRIVEEMYKELDK